MNKADLHAITRRSILRAAAAAAAGAALPAGVYAGDVHGFRHGAFDIRVVSDGFLTMPTDILLPEADPEERGELLARIGGNAAGAPFQTNIPLVKAGADLILIDTGSGGNFQPTAGRLAENLAIMGVDPGSITKVVFTHAHPDHSGATTKADGSLLFPNADYFIRETESRFWTDKDYEAHMPPALHAFARGAQRDLLAVKDRLTLLKNHEQVVQGMHVEDTPGHTPGHVSVVLEGSDDLIITGDVVTHSTVFFQHPAWHFGFDTDQEMAIVTRKAFLDRAASEKIKLLGYHWTYPGLGYAERNEGTYRFVSA